MGKYPINSQFNPNWLDSNSIQANLADLTKIIPKKSLYWLPVDRNRIPQKTSSEVILGKQIKGNMVRSNQAYVDQFIFLFI